MFLRSELVMTDTLEIRPVAAELPNAEVAGTFVTALEFQDQIATMVDWAKQRLSKTVCVANVHMLMEARWNDCLKTALEQADLTTPDGMPLVWVMRALGWKRQDRVAGMDIFCAICQQCVDEKLSLFLLGSTPEVIKKIETRLRYTFPFLKIAGVESPPFRPMTHAEDAALVERINQSNASFTFVSLGCPKQECWMQAHRGRVKSVMVGVGGVFPVFAGLQRRAPKQIRQLGLEWLYRLMQEPRRLCGRYLKTNTLFIFLVFRQLKTHALKAGLKAGLKVGTRSRGLQLCKSTGKSLIEEYEVLCQDVPVDAFENIAKSE